MSSGQEIETAIRKLSRQAVLAFRDWFSEFDGAAWDKQIEEHVGAGYLDALADEAIRDLREGAAATCEASFVFQLRARKSEYLSATCFDLTWNGPADFVLQLA
jgi:hypothetical protein